MRCLLGMLQDRVAITCRMFLSCVFVVCLFLVGADDSCLKKDITPHVASLFAK